MKSTVSATKAPVCPGPGVDMAHVRIIHTWPDDAGSTDLEVYVEADYPDALAEALTTVLKMWRATVGADEA